MAQKTIQGNQVLARQIRSKRSELGLTIEEASSRAGVGTKTWCRYEAGGSIRIDKCKGMILSILVYTFFSRMFDLMLPPVAKHSIVVA